MIFSPNRPRRVLPAPVRATILFLLLGALLGAPLATASANTAWVRGEIRLNLRSGAGTQYKILDAVETGDELEVLATNENWTRVRTQDGQTGWIPGGYLEDTPPASLRLEEVEAEAARLRAELEELRTQTASMRETNATLSAADIDQREQIEALRMENYELRAGTRYREWITGALIAGVGMLIGVVLQRRTSRRAASRIRL